MGKCRSDEYKIKLDAESSDHEAIKKLEDEHELHLRKAECSSNSMKDIENIGNFQMIFMYVVSI